MMGYVIIGNSIAGINAIEGIREYDRETPITVVSGENHYAYGRPLITYWMENRIREQEICYRPQEFYEKNNVRLLLGRWAVKIDPEERFVYLDSGEVLRYDRLLLATGCRPVLPAIPGLSQRDYFTLNTYDDARRLREAAGKGQRAVVLGSGPTGLKAMESLVHLGLKATLVELADRIWPQALDGEAADLVAGFLRKKGVDIRLNDTISEAERAKDGSYHILLKSGRELHADLLVTALGVRPNVELLEGLPGASLKDGVVVRPDLSTGLPGVYAAGDVVAGSPRLLPHAAIQGKIAGRNMAGAEDVYTPLAPYNSIGFLGLNIISMGKSALIGEECETLVEVDRTNLVYRRLVIKDKRLVGALLINKISRAGIYRYLIDQKIEVTQFKERLLQPDFGLLSLPESVWQKQLAV